MVESDLEARLQVLEQEPKPKLSGSSKGNKRIILIAIVALVGGAILSTFFFTHNQSSDPIPNNIRKSVSFPFYYPVPVPKGYQYRKDSTKVESNILFYYLQSSGKVITITEQAIPGKAPDLTQIAGFKSLDIPIGKAVNGTNAGNRPAVIILSDTTLITINGDTGTTATSVNDLARSMRLSQ